MTQHLTEWPSDTENAPLEGVRVIEFGQIAAGPFAGMLLADMGADVVKVERPGTGDGMREWPPIATSSEGEAFSENFASLNRNKRSICVDLKNDPQRSQLKALCAASDVVLENFRPGVLDKYGLGYEALTRIAPHLVYCSISGYGQTGPMARKGAFDVTVQAMSGLMSVTGEKGGMPVKCGVPVGDFASALYAVSAIVAALFKVRTGKGKGTYIDCSMFGSLLGIAALQTSEYFGSGRVPRQLGSAHPRNAPYQAFNASDKQFVIAAGNQKLWKSVCEVVSKPDLYDEDRFSTQLERASNQEELAEILESVFVLRTADEWLREFDERGVPCAPINNYAEALSMEQIGHMQLVRDLQLPNGCNTKTVGFPIGIGKMDTSIRRAPPQLGEHTEEVFAEWLGSETVGNE